MRMDAGRGWLVIALLWFGIPTITNHRPFVSRGSSPNSPRALRAEQVLRHVRALHGARRTARSAARRCVASWSRSSGATATVLVLAGGAVGWVVVEIAFALHGWPARPALHVRVRRRCDRARRRRVRLDARGLPSSAPERARGDPALGGIPVAAVLVAALVPGAVARDHDEHRTSATSATGRCRSRGLTGRRRSSAAPAHPELRPARHRRRLRQHPRLLHAPERRQGGPPAGVRARADLSDDHVQRRPGTAGRCCRAHLPPQAARVPALASPPRCFTGRHPDGRVVHLHAGDAPAPSTRRPGREPPPARTPSDPPSGETLRGRCVVRPIAPVVASRWRSAGRAVLVVWARTRPGFDPYGWLVWGHQTLQLGARHERRAVVEAAAVPVHGAVRAVRTLRRCGCG